MRHGGSVGAVLVPITLGLLPLVMQPSAAEQTAAIQPAPELSSTAGLWDRRDAGLQEELELVLSELALIEAVTDRKLAVALVDVSDGAAPRVATVNGDRMMYAASLPKIAILLGALHRAQSSPTAMPAVVESDLHRMIRHSSNRAATRVLDWVGRDELLALLQSPTLRLYDPARNGGLWVGKDYGPGNAFRRDPLHNLSHGATAMQTARFFYLLETGQLLDPEHSERMKAVLADPGIKHKLVSGLAARPQARLYRKSGTWRHYHADSALVESGEHRFIVVVLAAHPRGGRWISELAVPLHDIIVRPNQAPHTVSAGR